MKKRQKDLTSKIRVIDWIEWWKQHQKLYIKESTYATYTVAIENHILPYFGDKRMQDITTDMNQKFILFLSEEGRLDGKGGLSAKSIKDIMIIWNSILNSAIDKELIYIKPCKYRYPKSLTAPNEKKCLNKNQEKAIVEYLKREMTLKNMGILLALVTGMRIGEICALKWDSIDLDMGCIYVFRTLQRIYTKSANDCSSQIIETNPKSINSQRVIPLSRYWIKELKKHQAEKNAYFLTGSSERFIEPRTYRSYYTRRMKKANLFFVPFHGLRHTFATRCIENGCDYKTLSELLGHADINTTLRIYVHSDLNKKRKYITAMQDL